MYLLTRCNHSLNVKVACTKFNVTICPSYKTKLIERKYILFFFLKKRRFVQIHSPYLSCFGYARLLRRQLRSQPHHFLFFILTLQYSLSKQSFFARWNLSLKYLHICYTPLSSLPLHLSLSLSLFLLYDFYFFW